MSTIFVLSTVSFATEPDIPANTTTVSCTDSALNSNGGPTNIEVNWEPNEINLHWYADENATVELSVPATAQSCTYDETLTPPATIPTRTGYTFKGWRVRPKYDFSTLSTAKNGIEKWAREDVDKCGYLKGGAGMPYVSCATDDFNDLGAMEWKVRFSWGTVYGMAKCSETSVAHGVTGNPTDDSGGYCWCKMVWYKSDGVLYAPLSDTPWVGDNPGGTAACTRSVFNCVAGCAYWVLSDVTFRRALFGVSQ